MSALQYLATKFQVYWLAVNYWIDGDDWRDAVAFARRDAVAFARRIVEGFVR